MQGSRCSEKTPLNKVTEQYAMLSVANFTCMTKVVAEVVLRMATEKKKTDTPLNYWYS